VAHYESVDFDVVLSISLGVGGGFATVRNRPGDERRVNAKSVRKLVGFSLKSL
jgi:hypothetical protein